MWTYQQSTGALSRAGAVVAHGYSGLDLGKNNPKMEAARGIGPIPEGHWQIVGEPYNSGTTGPYTMALQPELGTDTLGRPEFRIHGDSIDHPGSASHGCIIMPPAIRKQIWASGDREIEVIA